MKSRVKNLIALVFFITPFIMLGGCATTAQLDSVRATATQAQATANEALQKANEAEKTANQAKTECAKCSQMFKKSLQK